MGALDLLLQATFLLLWAAVTFGLFHIVTRWPSTILAFCAIVGAAASVYLTSLVHCTLNVDLPFADPWCRTFGY